MKRRPLRMLITAGPTREYWDPVRFISNESTGTMGMACAEAARRHGHQVTFIKGPVVPDPPDRIQTVSVTTACEMLSVLKKKWPGSDALIMTAAVSDFRPQKKSPEKIGKQGKRIWSLKLVQNPDILKTLSVKKGSRCLAGFALETKKGIRRGWLKLKEKKLDVLVCNWARRKKSPFGNNKVTVALLDKSGKARWLRGVYKKTVAKALVDKIEQICYQKRMKGGDL